MNKPYTFRDTKLCGELEGYKYDTPVYICDKPRFRREGYRNYSHFCEEHAKEYEKIIENGVCPECGDKVVYPGAPKQLVCRGCGDQILYPNLF